MPNGWQLAISNVWRFGAHGVVQVVVQGARQLAAQLVRRYVAHVFLQVVAQDVRQLAEARHVVRRFVPGDLWLSVGCKMGARMLVHGRLTMSGGLSLTHICKLWCYMGGSWRFTLSVVS